MQNFKDYFYLKEEVITDIHHIFKTNIVQEIDISSINLKKIPDYRDIVVKGYFNCYYNHLTTLEGAPEKVGGYFNCYYNHLTTLEGAPEKVGGYFNCSNNDLSTLEGAPKKVGGNFICFNNHLTNLLGAPETVGGNFYCFNNHLTTLLGAPETVGGGFYCYNNPLTTLEGGPKFVKGDFNCKECFNIKEDQWKHLPIINGALITDKNLTRDEYLTLQRLQSRGRIGKLELTGKIEELEDDDPFNF
jgi:hypothetical protein